MIQFTLDNGINKEKDKGKQFSIGWMDQNIKVIGLMIWQMEKED